MVRDYSGKMWFNTGVLLFLLLLRCDKSDCNGLLRPNMVFFGETLDSHILTKVEKEMEVCDLCLVVGCLLNTNAHHGLLFFLFERFSRVFVGSLLTCRWAPLPSFTQQPCSAPWLPPGASRWQNLTQKRHPKPNTSRKSAEKLKLGGGVIVVTERPT